MDNMDPRLIAQALNYHGQQLQKVWESERNETELAMMSLKEPNFEIYQQRQKTLSFSDRGKRLKLQQFIAKKADVLYDKSNLINTSEPIKQELGDEEFYATMPGLDFFVPMEKSQRIRNFLESLIVGDVIFAQVMGKSAAGLLLKVLCNCSDFPRVVSDLGVKALILNTATVPAVDKKGVTRGYMANDIVCVVVGEVNVEAERVVAVMNVPAREGQVPHPPMGLVNIEDLPDAYRKAVDNKGQSYETIMESSTGFNNPNNIRYLSDLVGLGQLNYSNMVGLREKFPPNEYATELRQAQASKWAFRSVAEGIDHFKAGRHSEAFQCLNKALTVDPRNVEGLVARGALYANSGSFKKAIDDFETALKLNPSHANARKYMAETLVALGRSYEDEKKYEEALKAYENCLSIAPYHEEAKNSVEYIKSKTNIQSNMHTTATLEAPFKPFENDIVSGANAIIDPHSDHSKKESKKKRKKERSKRSKKRQRWSSSSSSTSGGGSTSSSSSSDSSASSSGSSAASSRSNSPDGDRSRSPGGRKKKHRKDHHGSSLSPLSKRMAQYNNPPAAIAQVQPVPPVVPVSATTVPMVPGLLTSQLPPHLHQQPPPLGHDILAPTLYTTHTRPNDKDDYEVKVRKFLEQTKDDSDYEEKVRKFLDETARWKREKEKEKKHSESDKKLKKKKKEKKAKDKEEKKLRKKKKKEERKKRKNKDKLERDLQTSLPDLEQLESKLNAYYAKVEKETAVNKRYVDDYNDMNSPLSNSEKLTDSARREEDLRLEKDRDDVFKSYHDRDPRLSQPTSKKDHNRKSFSDLFDQDSQSGHQDSKLPSLDVGSLNSKWKAVQSSKRETSTQKWQEVMTEKKVKPGIESEEEDPEPLRPLDKSQNIRKQMQKEAEKRAAQQQAVPTPPSSRKDSPHKSIAPVKYPTPQKYGYGPKEPTPVTKVSSLGHKFQPIGGPVEPPPPRRVTKGGSRSRSRSRSGSRRPRQPDEPPGRARGSRSRSRSGSGSSGSSGSRSRSGGRRSGSYDGRRYSRSRSGSFSHGSRSRSRSRSRSYSRSRSRSPFRRRPFQRQFGNQRGTYYKPRFQPFGDRGNNRGPNRDYNQQRYYNNGRGPPSRFDNRRGPDRYHNQRGGNRFDNRNRQMGNRGGRYFHNRPSNFRDGYRDRRDFRDRRYSRSYSPDPMRKVDEAKDRINRMIDEHGSRSRSRSHSRSKSRSHSSARDRSRSRSHRGRSRSRSGSRQRRHSHDRSHSKQHSEQTEQPAPPPEEEEDDYERWGQTEEAVGKKEDPAFAEDIAPEDKESFLQRMKQRSQNVLIKRAIEARTWYRPASP